jgi:HSP20 family molecular chaperone IbpA
VKRAFYFYVDVEKETMSAYLRHGVLEITIKKKDEEHKEEGSEIKVVPHAEVADAKKD